MRGRRRRRSAPRRRERRALRFGSARLGSARHGTARHDTAARPCVVEPGVSRGIAQANSAPRDDRRSRARALCPSMRPALGHQRRKGYKRRRTRLRLCDDSKRRSRKANSRTSLNIGLVERDTDWRKTRPRLAVPAPSGAAHAADSGVYLNKSRRLKSSGVHSLTGLHP